VPSITYDLTQTPTARWIRRARSAQPAAWDDRERCFEALGEILAAQRPPPPGGRSSQPQVSPPHLLTNVADRVNFAPEAVYQRWRARQSSHAIKRWAGPDQSVRPREAFVAEAKIVSFWPYREGVLRVADVFEMSLTELTAAYLRALGAWAADNMALAACPPAGPPPCVREAMQVLTLRRAARVQASSSDIERATVRLAALAGHLVAAILDDTSLTPLGAFNMVRDETLQLLSEPPDPVTLRVTNALSELADRLLYRQAAEPAISTDQIRQVEAEMTGLAALLRDMAGAQPDDSGRDVQPGTDT
jgi:hypothetical protein